MSDFVLKMQIPYFIKHAQFLSEDQLNHWISDMKVQIFFTFCVMLTFMNIH